MQPEHSQEKHGVVVVALNPLALASRALHWTILRDLFACEAGDPRNPCLLSEDKPISKRIFRIETEFMAARDRCRPADFRYDRIVWSKLRNFSNLYRHRTSNNTLDRHTFIQIEFTFREVYCRASTDTATRC